MTPLLTPSSMTAPPSDGWSRIVGRRTRLQIPMRVVAGPLAAASVTAAYTRGVPITDAALAVFLAFSVSAMLTQRNAKWAPLLPLMRRAWNGAGPFIGFLACVVLKAAAALPGVSFLTLALAALACGLVSEVPLRLFRQSRRSQARVRTAVVGSAHAAGLVKQEMELARVPDLTLVGRVGVLPADACGDDELVPCLGNLDALADVAQRNAIDLLVITGEVSRLEVYRQLATAPVAARVRAWDLSGFCEEFFGHVPMSEINATWFAYVMHPNFRDPAPGLKRAMDIALALVAGLATLPLLAVLALIIRRDGGPVFFKQVRIGEHGLPFTLHKLRTMRGEADEGTRWSAEDDPRVTRVGRLLRRTHIDELPQLLNVLRGEMSIVGPRPEVPEFVERLEQQLEFYPRRHLVKPGITGWAQVRCGYAGSDIGSAWKLCHDLYYLKHRSLALDLMIVAETARMLFVEPHRDRLAIGPWVLSRSTALPVVPAHSEEAPNAYVGS